MGACAVDIDKVQRKYRQKYSLDNKKGMHALLRDVHRLRSAKYERGDFAAADILIDLNRALGKAGLTNRQAAAVFWVYEKDLSKVEAAEKMDITKQAIGQLVDGALRRIAAIFAGWNYGEVKVGKETAARLAGEEI